MCGIFGYIGARTDAAEIVFGGLKTLEYRGYDSWGVATRQKTKTEKEKTKFAVEKHTGKIGNSSLNSEFATESSLAIGHTRWATHGGVTDKNAHPHLDCNKHIAVVHNGIIENFQELKKELIEKGHTFISETDTEILPHLIEEMMKDGKKGFATSVRDTFNKLRGMNAIVVAYAPSREIIAAKNGSPLAVGIGKDELLIASDAAGIAKYTKDVIFLGDNQMVILGDKVKLLELPNGNEIQPVITKLTWHFEDNNKGTYPNF